MRSKTPPLATWETPFWFVELHKQKVGFVLWARDRIEGGWEWGAYEAREDAEREVAEFYAPDLMRYTVHRIENQPWGGEQWGIWDHELETWADSLGRFLSEDAARSALDLVAPST